MTPVPQPHVTAAASAAAAAASPALWWIPLAGAAATLLAVTLTVGWSAFALWRQAQLTKKATQYQLIGAVRVAENRLATIAEERHAPSDGYAAFERVLTIAYSAEVASLMAGKATINAFFADLGGFENELGSMRNALGRANELARDGHASTLAQNKRNRETENAAAAAVRAAVYLARMREHTGKSRIMDDKAQGLGKAGGERNQG